MCWSWKNRFWTVSTLGGCGGHERTDFEQFLLWDDVVVLKEQIFNSFYFGGCGGRCGGLERTDFEQFLLWDDVVVLKEQILNSFYFGRVWWSWKNWFWTVSTFGGCGGHERTAFEQFLFWEVVVMGGYGRCTGKHWEHTRGCLNISGVGGIRMESKCMGASKHMGVSRYPKHMGVSSQCPPCIKVTCH